MGGILKISTHLSFYLKIVFVCSCLVLSYTIYSLAAIPSHLPPQEVGEIAPEFLDSQARPLNITFRNQFKRSSLVKPFELPKVLRDGFVISEDQRFYTHRGVDWRARAKAVFDFVRHGRVIRGASSITEQVVRIVYPRPRTLWTRWIEGWDAIRFERKFNKQELLSFYVNQVPYGAQRRGVVEAARFYFGRDLSTLNLREQLALVVLVRAPERLSPKHNPEGLNRRIDQLAQRMRESGALSSDQFSNLQESRFSTHHQPGPIEAGHFVQYLKNQHKTFQDYQLTTTLDGELQKQLQQALRISLRRFKENQIQHGAILVVDQQNGAILAWVNDRVFEASEPGSQIDAVLVPRQPGSTLKPFVYAEAIERGWTAATVLDDSPLVRQVGAGLHRYKNYSRNFHGPVRLRIALGSSLNIPAILGAEFVGRAALLLTLRAFGLSSLHESADYYGEGLALGNGEVSLKELVTAYATLARGGRSLELKGFKQDLEKNSKSVTVVNPESAAIISDILADNQARALEFGRGGVLQFPTETAVKTGTSTGYRDLWAIGYSARFTVGVWMGNLDRTPTRGVTSTQGPAVLLRSVFSLLERRWDGARLPRHGELERRDLCLDKRDLPAPQGSADCRMISELFSKKAPAVSESKTVLATAHSILVPSPGLVMARDPRIPDNLERLAFTLNHSQQVKEVRWYVDGALKAKVNTDPFSYAWALEAGPHRVRAEVDLESGGYVRTQDIEENNFMVQ